MKYIMYRISVAEYTYIGSTKDFNQRKKEHKSRYINGYTFKVYEMIKENGGWDKSEMIPIEEYECENNTQARIREEYWRREYDAKMNSRKAYISKQEYDEIQKEPNKERCKKWYIDNQAHIIEYRKTIINCECGSNVKILHYSRHIKTKKHLAFVASNTNQEYNSCGSVCVL